MRTIYLICRPCVDSYYDGHATDVAFESEADAQAYLLEKNGVPNAADDDYFDLYMQKVVLK